MLNIYTALVISVSLSLYRLFYDISGEPKAKKLTKIIDFKLSI